ncbi:unnamed protein product [Dovyalis caffra]|uniref:Uncharacterized protein n=1 Tax=Dovyalis caffra TaxID=77055 RepID=A0AAV1S0T4_9ROSI|nr:unnamed protein product [Dovyalis caffra]
MKDDQEDEDDCDNFQSFPALADAVGTVSKAESAAEEPDLVEKSTSESEFEEFPTSKPINNEIDTNNAEHQEEVISDYLGHNIRTNLQLIDDAVSHEGEEGAASSQENIEISPDLKVFEDTEGSIQVNIVEDYEQTRQSPRTSIDHQVSPDDFKSVEEKMHVEKCFPDMKLRGKREDVASIEYVEAENATGTRWLGFLEVKERVTEEAEGLRRRRNEPSKEGEEETGNICGLKLDNK